MQIRQVIRTGLGLALAAAALTVGTMAYARSDIGFSIGISAPGVVVGAGLPGYYAPAPSYYAPAPTYYTPAPAYYPSPAPIYSAPRPIVYSPPVYVAPAPIYYGPGRGYYRERHWEHERWERRHGRDHDGGWRR